MEGTRRLLLWKSSNEEVGIYMAQPSLYVQDESLVNLCGIGPRPLENLVAKKVLLDICLQYNMKGAFVDIYYFIYLICFIL